MSVKSQANERYFAFLVTKFISPRYLRDNESNNTTAAAKWKPARSWLCFWQGAEALCTFDIVP